MWDWLYEARTSIYLVMGVAVIILGALWWRNRKRPYLHGLFGALAAILLFFLFDRFVRPESDREQIQNRIVHVTSDFSSSRLESQLAPHISPDFVSPAGNRKDAFCKKAAEFIRGRGSVRLAVWDFDFTELSRQNRTARVRFAMRVQGGGFDGEVTCLATFHLDDDNQWRLKGYKIFFPPYTQEEFTSHPF